MFMGAHDVGGFQGDARDGPKTSGDRDGPSGDFKETGATKETKGLQGDGDLQDKSLRAVFRK